MSTAATMCLSGAVLLVSYLLARPLLLRVRAH